MRMHKVSSSSVDSYGFDPETNTLRIVYKNKLATYDYANVVPFIAQELDRRRLSNESIGKFIDQSVKKGGFHYTRVA